MTRPRRRLPLILVIVVPVLALWPVVTAEFIPLDDPANVARNERLNPPTLRGIAWYWTNPYLNMYAPLTYTAWAGVARLAWMDTADARGVQLKPYVFHAANLLVHVVNVVLVYALLRKLLAHDAPEGRTQEMPTPQPWAACAGALLFALHPMQVEPVAWVTGFRDLIAATFALASLVAYFGASRRAYLLACAFLIGALLCKPTTVVVPLIAAALDVGVRGRAWRDVIKPVGGLLLIALPFALLTMRFQSAALTYTPPLWSRPVIAADALAFYAHKLALPARVGLDYGRSPRWLLDQPGWGWAWLAILPLAAAVWALRRHRWFVAAALVFVAALLPVLGLTKFDFQHHSTVADRYVYLAMIGPALLLAMLVRRGGRYGAVACVFFLLILAARSHAQAGAWKNGESIYRATLETNPDSLIANRGLGILAMDNKRPRDAERYFQAALRAHPNDPVTSFQLGNLYLLSDRPAEAVPHLRVAAAAREQAWVVTNYVTALARAGELGEAKRVAEEALTKSPGSAELHATLAAVLFRQGDRAGAAEQFRAALRINPHFDVAAQELAALEKAPSTSAPTTQRAD